MDENRYCLVCKVFGHPTCESYCYYCEVWGHLTCEEYCQTCRGWGHSDRVHDQCSRCFKVGHGAYECHYCDACEEWGHSMSSHKGVWCLHCKVWGHSFRSHMCEDCGNFDEFYGSDCSRLQDLVRKVEYVHNPCFSCQSEPTCYVPNEVVDCAIMAPSPFLSERVSSIKDESLVDSP